MSKHKLLIILCVAIFFIGLVGSLFLLNRPYGTWRVNIVQIENQKVRMLEADCPDHTCINMGWLDSSMPIVCLPNHLVIQFADMGSDIDAAVN